MKHTSEVTGRITDRVTEGATDRLLTTQRRAPLPVDSLLPQVMAALRESSSLVIQAAPGAGKTTRVPPALLEVVAGAVIVLEPRRIAARMAARRVASELGEAVGETVGYKVRFEESSGPRTRLHFVTEGILTRRLMDDPELAGVDAVILDEFHERHLETDLALALLKRLQRRRPELKLIVMSATLDAGPIARFLDDCTSFHSEGRMFPLSVTHLPYSPKTLEERVRDAVGMLRGEGNTGHVLIFLPGVAEIRHAMRSCEAIARASQVLLLPLHGNLSPEEQDRAVAPSLQPKLIFATNVAESSVTVEGVSAVIDSGLARVASYSPWTGLPTLSVARISKASAQQRAGRAGRTGPGRVLRLYAEEDLAQRPDHDTPEILRSDLAPLGLALRSMKIAKEDGLEWLDSPSAVAMHVAESLLDRLGATADMAKRMARYPLPPRVARMLVEAVERGAGAKGCSAAALLASGQRTGRTGRTDLLEELEAPPGPQVQREADHLRRLSRVRADVAEDDEAILKSMLVGFPDRVGRLRAGNQLLLSTGNSVELVGEPPPYEFMVVLDAEDRPDKPLPAARLTTRIEPEWLIELFPDHVFESRSLAWNRSEERVEEITTLSYDQLVLQEWRDARPQGAAVTAMLAEKVVEAGLSQFVSEKEMDNLLSRAAFAGCETPDIEATLDSFCTGMSSFAELRKVAGSLLPMIEATLDTEQLRSMAPTRLRLPSGREVRVHYEQGKPPWIASRLQDFFGLLETPRIGRDRVPVVVHLLAPNQRPVQTTVDLAGFWDRLYPQVRRELARRYPRHAWPEKPL